ncbi:unnamed protein product [Cuscuta campestris]|uniref:Reverse transcriptase zinc-binding domain-containing protein n=1 Tax=Cuscuta campestris TaxID=132261 RepID=A0A484MU19_9ASTE|nr:unnamed protein product [Cuscuta campestris]
MMLVRKEFAGMPCSSEYTVKEGYKWLAGNQSRVEWAELVWNKTSVPKHQFIAWLIWRGRLLTKDRLSGFLPIDPTCIMCTKEKETVDHLFCSCPFAVDIFLNVSGFIQFDLTSCSIAELGQKPKEGKNKKDRCFIAACIAICCYYIWKARNAKQHNKEMTKESTLKAIVEQISFISINK